MPRPLLEVCIETLADALAAERGGADRLELCADLDTDGLTPTAATLAAVRAAVRLPVVVMVRPRAGSFACTAADVGNMARDIDTLLPLNPHGFVLGPLLPCGRVHVKAAAMLKAMCGRREAVFHRAFDETPDPREALEELIALGVTRILTSGRKSTALEGASAITETVRHAAGRIEVLPCGGIRAGNAAAVLAATGCKRLHGSFHERVSGKRRTSEAAVRAARTAVDHWAAASAVASASG